MYNYSYQRHWENKYIMKNILKLIRIIQNSIIIMVALT